ncbi:uncharacterized protein LOC124488130 isoform X2 [Hypomesus transpacificus]|uniref:uncharacterized protein LOC124488130 isoform X2 n=1 Tax=Hypomesus transpacificus TaxID=137520 RepID=UPI001F0752EB|nr:uncharacterized protein LOC124488130 isoform X2 [Hypomesus transpacificus]
MKTITINLIFFFHLSFDSIMVIRGLNLATHSVQLINTTNRLSLPEKTPSDLMTHPTYSDDAVTSATDQRDNDKTNNMESEKVEQKDTASKVMQVVDMHDQSIWGSANSYDHQHIVIMENKPEVIESALFLFERCPTRSTLLSYDKGALHVLKGSETDITRYSIVTLVGHGTMGNERRAQLGGYEPEELAQVVAAMAIGNTHLGTLSLVGCELGKDLSFAKLLLQTLRSLHVETTLHLSSSKISVNPYGEIVTEHEGVWRTKDTRKKVIAQLDQRGGLLTKVETGQEGQAISNYQGHALYIETLEWPTHPQMFVPKDLRKKYTSIDCLEGLTWSLFFEQHDKRRAHDYIPNDNRPNFTAVWLLDKEPDQKIPIKHIATILDLAVEIRYNAREDAELDLYYVLNDCIYQVQRKTFRVFLVGKYMNPNNLEEILKFTVAYRIQKKYYSLQELTQGLNPSEFNHFCRQTFQLLHCVHNCENWGRYFMAAVFSASVHNFRTFSLFLMSVIACEVGRSKGSDDTLCTAFVGKEHPMASEDPSHENQRRGFYGCMVDQSKEIVKQEKLVWLNEVVAKENSLFTRSKQIMSGVDHDQETEIDIFGKVKVMNKYVFSSFLEFFRGTPEGKKLVRGCIGSPQQNVHVEDSGLNIN